MNRIEQLEEFLRENPHDPFLHYALTMEYVKAQDSAKTEAGFINLITNFPDYVGSYYHYGKFLEKQAKNTQAEEIYRKGIAVATKVRNHHAKGELMSALNMLLGAEDEDDY